MSEVRRIAWGAALALVSMAAEGRPAGAQGLTIKPFRESGGQVHWSPSGPDRIAFAAKGGDGYYDVYLADPDGRNEICVTANNPELPGKHMGSPAWHPTRKYIVFVAEKASHPGSSYESIPGFGGYSDLWCVTEDGKKAYRLTDLPNTPDFGVLIPRFSPDGARVAWTQRVERPRLFEPAKMFGCWELRIADFEEGPNGPRLVNSRRIEPGGRAFYESYGFSPDGRDLIFCSNMNKPSVWDQDIYRVDAATGGNLRRLTNGDYNEHAFFRPGDGSIYWMTNKQSTKGGTDWWVMGPDGGNPRRLTYFNEPDHPHFMGAAVWAGLGSFSPDGRRFIGDIQTNLITQDATIKMIELGAGTAGQGRAVRRRGRR